jgi:hypothetical protein
LTKQSWFAFGEDDDDQISVYYAFHLFRAPMRLAAFP